ncbi:MAG TPA: HD domain-containing protein [Solirubrobacterales bacterium]|nr:HD domain-containing protein [Solirubrobacterales bacterium]
MTAVLRGAGLAERLRDSPIAAAAAGAIGPPAWVVGGAVRDAALGRSVRDLDIAVAGSSRDAAAALAAAAGGHAFELSAEHETWRAAARDGRWQADVTPLRGDGIEGDLALRDFTLGAVAVPLRDGAPLDPHGGLDDLEARVLRAVGDAAFEADPLRLLRAGRLAAELGAEIEPRTADLARASAGRAAEPAGERILGELRNLVASPEPLRGLALLDGLGVTAHLLPEVEATKAVEQNPNHHLDVHGHTLAVIERLLEVERDLDRYAGPHAEEVRSLLAEPLADGFSRGDALRLGALLHDIGKPATRGERDGYVTFIGHDRVGAEMVGELAGRLRASRRLTRHLQSLTRNHLRLGFLVRERPLPPRRAHEYLRATEPASVDVTLLTVADRLAARGAGPVASEEMVQGHLELAAEMIAAGLDWRREGPPPPLVGGEELAEALGVRPGPQIGELLAELEAAQYAGEVRTREEAIERARRASAQGSL